MTGLTCLAQILEGHGWRVENLGANVPGEDLQRFVAGREVDLVALSIVSADRLPELKRAVRLLRDAHGRPVPVPIMVGGRGVAGVEGEIPDVDHVGRSLGQAEEYVAGLGARLGLPADR